MRLYAESVEAQATRLERLRALRHAHPHAAAFVGVFAATLSAFLAVGAVLPVLPRYVTGPIGAGDIAVGIVVGAVSVTAVFGRPIGGRLADARGRRLVVVVGLLLTSAGGLLYLVPLGVPGLVLARMVLGFGDGWVFTAGLSWIVDLAPEERRGQAIGMFGLAVWGGLSAGPLLGQAVFELGSYELVFALAALVPLVGVAIARAVPDRHVPAPPGDAAPALIPRGVIAPGIALALANLGYGTMTGFVVLLLADGGIGHGATVFTVFAAAVVISRLALSRLPDLLGPRVTAACAGLAEAAGLALLALASSLAVALVGALVMGIGFSLLFPSLALTAMNRTGADERATAIGAFTAFFDIGVGIGAPVAGAVSAIAGYEAAFYVAAATAAAGAVIGAFSSRGGRGGDARAVATAPG